MSERQAIAATVRAKAGKGNARKSRDEGMVPAVIYGEKKPADMINIEKKEFMRLMQDRLCKNKMLTINADKKAHTVMMKDIQLHPVTDQPLHADFLRVGPKTKVIVNIPVEFTNEDISPGLKRGGVLNVVRLRVEMICEAANIPEKLICDVSPYQLGDTIHISAIDVPDTAKPTIDRDFTIASITIPSGIKSALRDEKDAENAAAEGESSEETETAAEA